LYWRCAGDWLLSAYTIRLNHRHKLFGHVFRGRYKALLVEGSGNGYLKTACDYVHLNPARAGLIGSDERLLAYLWSSLVWYLAAREHRPGWVRVDRLLGEHGIPQDSPAGRQEFERHLEQSRLEEESEAALKPFRRGWCLGSEAFRNQMLEWMEGRLGENHSGGLHLETAEQRANGIIAAELVRLGWTERDFAARLKNDPGKLAVAAHVRRETTLPIKWIAGRLQLGSAKSARAMLHQWMQNDGKPAKQTSCAQLQFQPMVDPLFRVREIGLFCERRISPVHRPLERYVFQYAMEWYRDQKPTTPRPSEPPLCLPPFQSVSELAHPRGR
jgi:hypothetical protein